MKRMHSLRIRKVQPSGTVLPVFFGFSFFLFFYSTIDKTHQQDRVDDGGLDRHISGFREIRPVGRPDCQGATRWRSTPTDLADQPSHSPAAWMLLLHSSF